MIAFDVNVLVYAHRSDQPEHTFFRQHLESLATGDETVALSPLVAAGFARVVTNPRFPNGPTPLPQALAVIDSLADLGHFHWVNPGTRHWQLTADLCRRTACYGKTVADAQHAALAIEHACTWLTPDRDFKRFTPHGLKLHLLEP